MAETSLDKLQQIADQGSPMTIYEMAEAMYQAINERILPGLLAKGVKKYPMKDFFVHIETGSENVIRKGMPVPKVVGDVRISMPLPNYEQQVYMYKYNSGEVIPLWVIPDANTCAQLRVEALNLMPEERVSLDWVLNFYDGTYANMSNDYNKNLKV